MSKKNLHLPDCPRVQFPTSGTCDCGTPPHPLPWNKKLVRDQKGRIRMVGLHGPGKSVLAPSGLKPR